MAGVPEGWDEEGWRWARWSGTGLGPGVHEDAILGRLGPRASTSMSPKSVPRGPLSFLAPASCATDGERGRYLVSRGTPCVITDLDMGECVGKWDAGFLQGESNEDRHVECTGVHLCQAPTVDLAGHRAPNTDPKNFEFATRTLGDLVGEAERLGNASSESKEGHVYLRSVGAKPSKEPSDVRSGFPALARDVVLPEGVLYDRADFHSSVLRVSSAGCALWTHFDTMDNVLMQVVGAKTVTLWPPSEDENLYTDPAGSSSRVDPELAYTEEVTNPLLLKYPRYSLLASQCRWRTTLRPGDALLIPALWFHHVLATRDAGPVSVAVNVFWRGISCGGDTSGMYRRNDVYGNKPPLPVDAATNAAMAAAKTLARLPEPYRTFYARRVARALVEAATSGPQGMQKNGTKNGTPHQQGGDQNKTTLQVNNVSVRSPREQVSDTHDGRGGGDAGTAGKRARVGDAR